MREQPTAQQHGERVGVNLLALGFAPVQGCHREGVAQDTGKSFLGTEVCQPLPGAETLPGYLPILAVGREDPPKRCGRGG